MYYCQFKDDPTRVLVTALNDHFELLSRLCDLRLGLDPSPFGRLFFAMMHTTQVHSDYRAETNRQSKYEYYSVLLAKRQQELGEHLLDAQQVIQRMQRIMAAKRKEWPSLEKLFHAGSSATAPPPPEEGLALFCSYSHKDDGLRNALESHLAMLRRDKAISIWHDRRITAGTEWKGEINANLTRADIVLLLVSADFINSDYCFDVEMTAAMAQHKAGSSRVVPIIVRECDWHSAPFGKLQALPKDGRAASSWQNLDEALTDVAKGLRSAVAEIRTARGESS